MTMAQAKKPTRKSDVETKLLPDGNVVLFSTKHEWAHTITPLAGVAWEYCDGKNDVPSIIERVLAVLHANDGEGSPEDSRIADHIEELLLELEESGLIECSG